MNKNLIVYAKWPARGQGRLPESYYVESADGFAASFSDGMWQLGCLFDENQLRKDFRDTGNLAHRYLWRARMSFVMRELEKLDCWRTGWTLHFENRFVEALQYFVQTDELADTIQIEIPGPDLHYVLKLLTTWSLARGLSLAGRHQESLKIYGAGQELITSIKSKEPYFSQAAYFFESRFRDEWQSLGTSRFEIFRKSIEKREDDVFKCILKALYFYGTFFGNVPNGMTFKFATMIGDSDCSLISYPGLPPLNPYSSKPKWPFETEQDALNLPGGFYYKKLDTWSCEIGSTGVSETDPATRLPPRKVTYNVQENQRSLANRESI